MEEKLKDILGNGSCVVDLGCGSGHLLRALADRFEQRIGLDVSRTRLGTLAGGNTLDGAWDDGHIHYFTHRDLRELFDHAGFRRVHSAALIDLTRGGWLRRRLDRHAGSWLVREFLSGNILLWAER